MTAPNQIVVLISAPLALMFVLMALYVRRYGALHWVVAVATSWLAGVVDDSGADLQPLAVGLGSASAIFFALGARVYGDRPRSSFVQSMGFSVPLGLALVTALAGTSAGYAGMAISDTLAFVTAAVWVWPRGELRSIQTARVLPLSFLMFTPVNLYAQLSRSLGEGPAWPTLVIAMGLTSLAAVLLLALTARLVRDETLRREGLEARLIEREGELEESLVRARSAERLAAVGTLAAGIAHQINNPVGAILAAAQFELSDPLEDKWKEGGLRSTLETIEREAMRCARIVRSVLVFARTDPGRVADHDLNAIVEAARAATVEDARRRGAVIELRRSDSVLVVQANEVELEQVVVNLIRNAIESRPRGAHVSVRVEASSARALVYVEDDGLGLSEEARKRLFEPFFTTKLREGGSGLGLSVVHGILATHGGEIDLVPTSGSGTCFRVGLPRVRPGQ
ncbi:HAMP domain-containing histidine kinase [Myxococcota bacterium]|nr:HAMP domain-containing histidine kinase [Myxococcota bacterium]